MDPIQLFTMTGPELMKLGFAGVVIIFLTVALRSERQRSATLTERLLSIQDQRVLDAREQTRAVEANTAATHAGTTAMGVHSAAIQQLTHYVVSLRGGPA